MLQSPVADDTHDGLEILPLDDVDFRTPPDTPTNTAGHGVADDPDFLSHIAMRGDDSMAPPPGEHVRYAGAQKRALQRQRIVAIETVDSSSSAGSDRDVAPSDGHRTGPKPSSKNRQSEPDALHRQPRRSSKKRQHNATANGRDVAAPADDDDDGYDSVQAFEEEKVDDEIAFVDEASVEVPVRARRTSTFRRLSRVGSLAASAAANAPAEDGRRDGHSFVPTPGRPFSNVAMALPSHALMSEEAPTPTPADPLRQRDDGAISPVQGVEMLNLSVDDSALCKALVAVRVREPCASFAAVWRLAIARVRMQVRAAGVIKHFEQAAQRRARRLGVELGEQAARQRLEDLFALELLHLGSHWEAVRLKEAFAYDMLVAHRRRAVPAIGRHEAGVLSVDVSCRRALHDAFQTSLVEGGAYCKLRKGTYIEPAGRETDEMFDFDVPIADAAEPFVIEVWAADNHQADSIVGAFQLIPSGMPRAGKGTVHLSLHWNFEPTVQPGRRLPQQSRERLEATVQHQRQQLMQAHRDGSRAVRTKERYAWQALTDAFALDERLLSWRDKLAKTREVETFLGDESAVRRQLARAFHRDRLALVESLRRQLVEAEEAGQRHRAMVVAVERVVLGEAAWAAAFRARHGLASSPGRSVGQTLRTPSEPSQASPLPKSPRPKPKTGATEAARRLLALSSRPEPVAQDAHAGVADGTAPSQGAGRSTAEEEGRLPSLQSSLRRGRPVDVLAGSTLAEPRLDDSGVGPVGVVEPSPTAYGARFTGGGGGRHSNRVPPPPPGQPLLPAVAGTGRGLCDEAPSAAAVDRPRHAVPDGSPSSVSSNPRRARRFLLDDRDDHMTESSADGGGPAAAKPAGQANRLDDDDGVDSSPASATPRQRRPLQRARSQTAVTTSFTSTVTRARSTTTTGRDAPLSLQTSRTPAGSLRPRRRRLVALDDDGDNCDSSNDGSVFERSGSRGGGGEGLVEMPASPPQQQHQPNANAAALATTTGTRSAVGGGSVRRVRSGRSSSVVSSDATDGPASAPASATTPALISILGRDGALASRQPPRVVMLEEPHSPPVATAAARTDSTAPTARSPQPPTAELTPHSSPRLQHLVSAVAFVATPPTGDQNLPPPRQRSPLPPKERAAELLRPLK